MDQEKGHPTVADELRRAANSIREQLRQNQLIVDKAKSYAQIDERHGYFIGLSSFRANAIEMAPSTANGPLRQLTSESLSYAGLNIAVVDNAPNAVTLANCLSPRSSANFSLLMHLCPQVDHELFISDRLAASPQAALNIAHRVIFMLRIKVGILFKAVGISEVSWNKMPACEGTVDIQILEFEDASLWHSGEVSVTVADVEWCLLNSPRLFDLYEQPSFRLAFDSAGESPFLRDVRTSIARTWAGIEALFDVQHELSFRLSMYAAVLVADELQRRIDVQMRFKALYTKRSKAVHGAHMSADDLKETAYQSWRLLCELVQACIQTGSSIPSTQQLDRALLGDPLARTPASTIFDEPL